MKYGRGPLRQVLESVKRDAARQQVPLKHYTGPLHDDVLGLLGLGALLLAQPSVDEPRELHLKKSPNFRKPRIARTEKHHLVRLNGRIEVRLRKMNRRYRGNEDEPPPVEVQVKVLSKSRKGFSQARSVLHDPLKSFSVSGRDAAHGWDVVARFDLSGGNVEHSVTITVPMDVLRAQLREMYWPENEDLTLSGARYVLCSRDQILPWGDGGYRAGTNFAIEVRFGPNLQAAVDSFFPVTLVGQFVPNQDGQPDVDMTSFPFTLRLADAQVENASLRMGSQFRDGGRLYHAELRGLLKVGGHRLPVWTELPADDEVLCWQSLLPRPVELPLAELDPLMGGSGWRTRVKHLDTFLSAVGGQTWLVEAGLGVDLFDRASTDAHAIFAVRDFTLRGGDLAFRNVRLEWEWSHESGEAMFQISARMEFCGLTFNALFVTPGLMVLASLAGRDISRDQAMQDEAEGLPPEGIPELPPMMPLRRVADHAGQRLRSLDPEIPALPLEVYSELHLYYCWRTNRLRLRAAAVVEGEVVESNWTLSR
ncbi:hypothetical protein [Myxococcus sp. RHSTA-1-4]|uniref:hypothetical protein n=1 Tax=Myxococcus sp. RHSTA-1-4 TaxID=2874601 RepID=UPI001CBF1938|nr:hypothetical protein [Myxococcus sp. RHSTA-1-4]MBZ4417709.1 hypothetical protein [Myxococcus sp. RHSTA-1-4]